MEPGTSMTFFCASTCWQNASGGLGCFQARESDRTGGWSNPGKGLREFRKELFGGSQIGDYDVEAALDEGLARTQGGKG